MDAASVAAFVSLAVSAAALAISIAAYRARAVPKHRKPTLSREKSKRIKRYVLLKVVCIDSEDPDKLFKELVQRVYTALGPALMARCGLALVAYRRDLGRAILRVSGSPDCVKHVLLALSMLHVLEDSRCLAVPLRTSGCLTRLRKALRVYRA